MRAIDKELKLLQEEITKRVKEFEQKYKVTLYYNDGEYDPRFETVIEWVYYENRK